MAIRTDQPDGPFAQIGGAIKILRTKAGLTQGQLADRAGITKSQVSHYETRRQRPNLDSLDAIMRSLDADVLRLASALGEAEDAAAGLRAADGERIGGYELRRRLRREVGLLIERYLKLLEVAADQG